MANDSSTGGYLAPAEPSPIVEDDDLARVLQAMVAGITGLDGKLVRPRWQPTVPKRPEPGVNWCAIGVTTTRPDANASIVHVSDPADTSDVGHDLLVRHATLEVLASFYGPAASAYAGVLRDGLAVPQNQEAVLRNGIAFMDTSDIVPAPELVNQQWVRRFDLPLRFRRVFSRTYAVLNLLSAPTPIET